MAGGCGRPAGFPAALAASAALLERAGRVDRGCTLVPVMKTLPAKALLRAASWLGLRAGDGVLVVERGGRASHILFPRVSWPPRLGLAVPSHQYAVSPEEVIAGIREVLDANSRVYIVSKFYHARYIDMFTSRLARRGLYIAYAGTDSIRRARGAWLAPTRSHRKLVVAVSRDMVVAYHGSMNVLAPGIDDYMSAVRDYSTLMEVLHGLVRAFLVV